MSNIVFIRRAHLGRLTTDESGSGNHERHQLHDLSNRFLKRRNGIS